MGYCLGKDVQLAQRVLDSKLFDPKGGLSMQLREGIKKKEIPFFILIQTTEGESPEDIAVSVINEEYVEVFVRLEHRRKGHGTRLVKLAKALTELEPKICFYGPNYAASGAFWRRVGSRPVNFTDYYLRKLLAKDMCEEVS